MKRNKDILSPNDVSDDSHFSTWESINLQWAIGVLVVGLVILVLLNG